MTPLDVRIPAVMARVLGRVDEGALPPFGRHVLDPLFRLGLDFGILVHPGADLFIATTMLIDKRRSLKKFEVSAMPSNASGTNMHAKNNDKF